MVQFPPVSLLEGARVGDSHGLALYPLPSAALKLVVGDSHGSAEWRMSSSCTNLCTRSLSPLLNT